MTTTLVQIEDIEAMRSQEGIDDVELREEIRGLRVGQLVRLTFLAFGKPSAGETLSVRITRINRDRFFGKLAERPASPALAGVTVGTPVEFTSAHIHSVPVRRTGN